MVLQIKLVVVVRTLGSGNVEAMGSNPVQVPEFFSGSFAIILLKLQLRQQRSILHLN